MRAAGQAATVTGGLGRWARMAALGGMLALLGACSTLVNNTGYTPSDIQLQDITVGKDTKDTVAEKIGTPPLEDLRRDGVWYYMSSRYETWAWKAPVEVERQVVAISFTDGGSVRNIERFGKERGQVVTLSRRVTDKPVDDIGFLRGLFQNTSLAAQIGEGREGGL